MRFRVQTTMPGKNYIIILISALSIVSLCVVIWAMYSIFFSGSALVKIPLSDDIFIAKNTDIEVSWEVLFDKYLSYMSELGYKYLPDEGMLAFEKDGKIVHTPHPKFIRINFGNVDKGNFDYLKS
jgi:hypothetical protein